MGFTTPITCKASPIINPIINHTKEHQHELDASYVKLAVKLSDKSACFTSPHPNFGCVIATTRKNVVGEGYLYAQGTKPAEVQAVEAAGEYCRGATAYVNMEPGDCHGDYTAVSSFIKVFEFFIYINNVNNFF